MKKLLLALSSLLISFSIKAQAPCPGFTFAFSVTDASCPNSNNGSATVTPSGGMAPYSYLWSTAAGSQVTATAANLMPGTYSVIVADMMGCIDTGFVEVFSQPIETPSICMVTCDANSVNNIIYWDQTPYTNVDSFIIYRETSPAVYSRIGAVSSDSLSEFTDTTRHVGPANGDPNVASYRYKIAIRDTCGNYGAMSPYHSTIYITDDGLGLFSWANPYTIEGAANPVTNYVLLCDTANVNVWGAVNTVGAAASSAMDPGFAFHSSVANWRVKTAWSIVCTPTRATVNTTRSNIKHGGLVTTGTGDASLNNSFAVYPDPAEDMVNIGFSPQVKKAEVRIVNMVGQLMYHETLDAASNSPITRQINITEFPKGVYMICVESAAATAYKKLIVN